MLVHDELSILIVEDDPIIAHDILIILKKHGYQRVVVCHKASKAIDRLASDTVDFVILDIYLGGAQSGIDIAKIIHEKYNLPYIFLTAFSDPETLRDAQEQGPYGYLVKPFQEATLLTTISIALSNHRSRNRFLSFDHLRVSLTEQEMVICRGLFEGKSYQQVADQQHISINTVRYHVKNLYLKFDVKTRAALIAKLIN